MGALALTFILGCCLLAILGWCVFTAGSDADDWAGRP